MRILWSIFFGFCLCFCQAQAHFHKRVDSIKGLEDLLQKAQLFKGMFSSVEKNDSLKLGILYHELGLLHYKTSDYSEALEEVQISLKFKESIRAKDAYSYQKSLNLLSAIHGEMDNSAKRIETLYRIVAEQQQTKFTIYAWGRLATHKSEVGDYFKSIEYSKRVVDSYEEHKNETYYLRALGEIIGSYAGLKSNDSDTLSEINKYKELMEEVKDSLDLDDQLSYYNNLGIIYRASDQKEQALISYEKGLQSALELEDSSSIHSVYVNIGELYSQMNLPEKADEYYQKVLSTQDSINISAVYNNIGYYHTSSVDQEIELHKKAIQILERASGFSGMLFFPEDIIESDYKEEFFSAFVDLSQAWIKKYDQTQNKIALKEALKVLYRIDNLIPVIRLNSEKKASKLFWIDRGVNSYLEAVKVCFLLDKPKEAFYFMEKNKSLYLLEQLNRLQSKNEYKIPVELIEKSKHLEYLLLQLKYQLTQDPRNESLQKKYRDASMAYHSFADSLAVEFPSFYRSSLKLELTSLEEFQTFLGEQESQAVSYILGEDDGYGLWTDAQEIHFFQLQKYASLRSHLDFLKDAISSPVLSKEEIARYRSVGLETFQLLFPIENALKKIESKSLKILPSGSLYGFPFEALLVDQKPILKENFLVHHAEISYLNSGSVAQSLYQNEIKSSYSYLGIAPVEFHSETLIDLKESEQVVNEVASLFYSDVLLKSHATKKEFLQPSQPAILHINTHAGIEGATQQPWLSLRDSLVYLEELYLKSQPHDLVFLDACKTAEGKLQRGEGIESLSKAFFHSGSKSIIASNWNANEKATNEISLSFFKEINQGNTKAAALRQAKLNYIENSQLSESLPYFWASLTLTGNTDAVSFPSYEIYYLGLAGIVLLLIFFLPQKQEKIHFVKEFSLFKNFLGNEISFLLLSYDESIKRRYPKSLY